MLDIQGSKRGNHWDVGSLQFLLPHNLEAALHHVPEGKKTTKKKGNKKGGGSKRKKGKGKE